ncbi:collagen alpha-1(I) chain-like [Phoenix dactylifera]|uniref:Collagen alpha-1(I) chain-like n=1 Tax=Phoenix dactylifera TaxID=42345 RepID=A0A8B9AFA1_PHODC|nr:collagen alpha-1(I) chain-like [Phoenix dactylifera]
MTPWVPDFEPGEEAVQTATVWLRLPRLPPEYWSTSTISHIAARVGRPVAVDSVTEQRQAMGFARVKVVVDTTKPLLPRVLIQGKTKVRWQPFVFESVSALCSRCGRMGHQARTCRFPATPCATGASGSSPVEANQGGGPAQPSSGGGEEAQGPIYGPWMVASRQRPHRETLPPRPGKMSEPHSGPGSSSTRPPPPVARPTTPVSPADTDGWQKPAKVARRRSPLADGGVGLPAISFGPFQADSDDLLAESGDPGPSLCLGEGLSRADPASSRAVAARVQTQKRPRPLAGLGPAGEARQGAQLALTVVGRGQQHGPAQRTRAHRAGRRGRGRGPVGAAQDGGRELGAAGAVGAPRAIGASRPRDAPGAEAAPGAAVAGAQVPLGPRDVTRGQQAARSAVEPRVVGLPAQPAVASLGQAVAGPKAQPASGPGSCAVPAVQGLGEESAGPFRYSPPSRGEHGGHAPLSEVQPWDVQGGTGPDGVFRFGPLPLVAGEQGEASSSGSRARDHLRPFPEGCQAAPPRPGEGTDHMTTVQRIRAAVMQSTSDEQGMGPGIVPEAGPAYQGEDGSEADYVDCDP